MLFSDLDLGKTYVDKLCQIGKHNVFHMKTDLFPTYFPIWIQICDYNCSIIHSFVWQMFLNTILANVVMVSRYHYILNMAEVLYCIWNMLWGMKS